MASQSRTIRVRFDGDANGLTSAAARGAKAVSKFKNDVSKSGDSVGKGFSGSFIDAAVAGLKSTVPSFIKNFGETITSGLKGVLSTPVIGPIISAAVLAVGASVAVGAGAAAGAAIGGGIVLGFGAGLAGLGATMLLYTEQIDDSWSDSEKKRVEEFNKSAEEMLKSWREFKRQVVEGFRDVAQPLKSTFDVVRNSLRDLGKEFKPVLAQAFQDMEAPLNKFVKEAIGALKGLAPAVQPLTTAFTSLLGVIGPQLKGIFKDLGNSLKDLGNTVSENRTVISSLFVALLKAIPLVIDGLTLVVDFFGKLVSVGWDVASALSKVFADVSGVVLGFVEKFLGVLKSMAQAIGNIPGLEAFSKSVVSGIDTAIGKVQEWKTSSQELNKKIEIQANIVDLTQKLDKARTELADPNLTKERRAELTADIQKLTVAKAKAVAELGDPKLVKEYRSNVTTIISDLQSQLKTARKELADPNLTKERKSKLNADIRSLQSQIATAKSALASIPNRTVSVFVKTEYQDDLSRAALRQATARAKGGPVKAGRTYLVGEEGPELLTIGATGGHVTPNNKINKRGVGDLSTVGSASHSSEPTQFDVRVFIGDQELTSIVRTEISERDRSVKRRALAGVAR